jgi:CheY-like chemotaxis protein
MSKKPGSDARILIADDDPAIRHLLCTIMRREHLEADCVADGAEAIQKLQQHEYAVVLLDLMMPNVDGFGVIAHLKAHPPQYKPVVLVISAYADQKFKQVDADIVAGVLRKPFEVSDIGTIIRLCAHGIDEELARRVYVSSETAIREFSARNEPR